MLLRSYRTLKKKNPKATIVLIRADLLRWVKLCPRLPKWVIAASDTILLNVTNLRGPGGTAVLLIRVGFRVWAFAKVNYEEHIRLAVNPIRCALIWQESIKSLWSLCFVLSCGQKAAGSTLMINKHCDYFSWQRTNQVYSIYMSATSTSEHIAIRSDFRLCAACFRALPHSQPRNTGI